MVDTIAPGTPEAVIVADEERLLGQVQARAALGDDDDGAPAATSNGVDADLISLRDQISEARAEDLPPLIEQMTRLAALRGKLGGSRTLPIDLASPYFAHIRLRESGKRRDVMIGKRGFIDRTSNVQIVDWRNAPVSRIYYRYEEGDDYEEEFAGKSMDGVVEARRNVSIHKGALRRIGAPQGTYIKDARGNWVQAVGTLQPVLHGGQGKAARPVVPTGGQKGKLGVHHGGQIRADKGLPEIAALIDKEQFELISHPESGIVLIQGGAGSGKTTVALHRVAYLNYADGRRFRANSMLFVVPSQALSRYVAGVLPALGVSGVPVVTYTSWARNTRIKLLPNTPLKYNDDPPETVSRVKKHPRFLTILTQLVDKQAAEISADLAATPGVTEPILAEWTRLGKRALVPRLWAMLSAIRKNDALDPSVRISIETVLKRWRKRADDVVTDWAELLTDGAALAAGFAGVGDVSAKDLDKVVAWVKKQIAAPQKALLDDEGNPILTSDGSEMGIDDDDPAGRVDDEDDPLFLRLIQLKRGGLFTPDGDELTYNHVAVDEAQDRSAIEIKVLVEAVSSPDGNPEHRSITIAGDTAQRLVFDNNFTGWADLLQQTGQPAIIRPLKLSYRSTAEVMLLAREVLGPDLAPDEPLVARSGEPVELHEFSDVGEAVAFLSDSLRTLMAREPTASVAVIARHPEQADLYFNGLARAEIPAMRRVKRDEFSFKPGIDLTDVTQVKGLEFDYVIMIEANAQSYPDVHWARHLMHIGVTRAAHQLWLVSTTEPSPLIPKALRDGGRMVVG